MLYGCSEIPTSRKVLFRSIMVGIPLDLGNPIGDAISSIRFAPTSDNLLISSWDSYLRLYDVASSVPRLESQCESPLLDCCFETELSAFTADSNGSIARHDLHTNTGSGKVIGNRDLSTCIRYSEETGQLIMGGFYNKVLCWDTRVGTKDDFSCLVNLEAKTDSMSLAGFYITIAVGKTVYTYDLRNFSRSIESKKSDMDVRIKCVSSASHVKGFAVGSVDGRVGLEMCPPYSNDIRYMFRCYPKARNKQCHLVSVNDIVFNPQMGSAFFTGDNEGYVIAWDAESRKRLFELPKFPNSISSLSVNRNGDLLAVASSFTYQEANEIEELPQIFIKRVDCGGNTDSFSSASSSNTDHSS